MQLEIRARAVVRAWNQPLSEGGGRIPLGVLIARLQEILTPYQCDACGGLHGPVCPRER